MLIAVDLRPLLEPFESGVTIYTKSLLRKLIKLPELNFDLFYQASKKCKWIHDEFENVRYIPMSNTKFHLKSIFRFPSLPNNYFPNKPDLIWIPDRRPFYRTDVPIVMTVHDTVPEECSTSLSFKSWIWHKFFSLNRLLPLCSGVLLPSFFVESKIPRTILRGVSYEGADLSSSNSPIPFAKKLKKRPYFVMIAPADPRKGISKLIKMSKHFPKVNFLIAAYKKSDTRFSTQKLRMGKNIFVLESFSESEKRWMLNNSHGLLALSSFEGFDLPVLEATRANCAVIMSDIPVHRELYKSGHFVTNEKDLILAINQCLNGRGKIPIVRGDYSWSGAAKRSLLLFRRVILNKN